ncbi:MFS general substrate transporter [Aulographum hederae CBS 113979]|uniref:MFS general substrate transporter n=1 Tax=Aulographum hederae CBS 113979 TaxID=1176131 RepID=A0A6G1HFC3_9PEZI|nr:MFS general substrate transporter [Aulographum hederae CBS 113979]
MSTPDETSSIAADAAGSRIYSTSPTTETLDHVENQGNEQTLPQADEGKAAWLVLAGCSLIQAPVWGFSLAFGVFQEYYTAHGSQLNGDITDIPMIGTTATGILYLCSPLSFAILSRWPHLRRSCGPLGLAILVISFVLSGFATAVWQLFVLQGVTSAIGCGLLFAPTTIYLDEWFIRRKGLALGILWSAKGLAGMVLPIILEKTLERFGAKVTLEGWATVSFLLTAPLLRSLRPRIPPSPASTVRRIDTSFLRSSTFWIFQTGNILQSLGYFLPSAYLPSYAVSVGLSPSLGTILIATLNGTSVAGSVVIGMLNDQYKVTTVILISTVGSTIAVFLCWGLSSHMALLVVFSMLYGFFAGGFSSTWSGVLTEIKASSPSIDTGFVFGLLAGGRGVGNIISGPLSLALLAHSDWLHDGKSWGYSTEFGPMIIFTGVSVLLGGFGWLWRSLHNGC